MMPRWAGEGEEPLFYRIGTSWHMSERLSELLHKLGSIGNSSAIEIHRASRSFLTAMDHWDGKLPPMDGPEDHKRYKMNAVEAYNRFVAPFVWRMSEARLATPEDADKIKQEAFHWLSQVIDFAFRRTSTLKRDDHRASLLIYIASDLCKTFDRLPRKKEVWEEARKRNPELFTVGEDVERTLLKRAGLASLPQARKGGK